MTTAADQPGVIKLSTRQLQHPELLTGLEFWLQLGLLSQTQVKRFCSQSLCCTVPVAVLQDEQMPLLVPAQSDANAVAMPTDFADAKTAETTDSKPSDYPAPHPSRPATWLTQSLQTIMAEIGVIWLLCLGVFMVVVSSGVLAATQWQNFSPVGQYSILLAYTLLFWLASLWTSRQPALRLTAQMLQTATLLIIPMNFWMMDGLRLWQSGFGIGVNLLAAAVLTYISLTLIPRLAPPETHRQLVVFNSIGLSWLHWGWSIAAMPLLATYAGTIGTALLTYRRLQSPRLAATSWDETRPDQPPSPAISLPTLMIALSTLLLIGRAILAAQIPVQQLGLAFGICGWLFCWLARPDLRHPVTQLNAATSVWLKVGIGLLGLGWLLTVNADPPWQAIAVSGLGLWLLGDRLRQRGTVPQLVASLLLGLHTYLMLGRLLPISWREQIITTVSEWFGTAGMPNALLGLLGLPYLWLLLVLSHGLRRQQPQLAKVTEMLALVWGGVLLLLSAENHPIRSLSFSLLALTLALIIRRRRLASGWLYLAHGLILAALASWVDTGFPNLSPLVWAQILLAGMVIEWGLSLRNGAVRQSCWHFGLGLAILSYGILLAQTDVTPNKQNLIWLLTPICLTGLTRLRQFSQPRIAAWLSTGSLIATLFLFHTIGGWMISLAVATGLMLINTLTLQKFAAALLTIGFALGFEATAIWYYFANALTFERVLLLLVGNLWVLWLAQDRLARRAHRLPQPSLAAVYAAAANVWAIVISLMSLTSLSVYQLFAYEFSEAPLSSSIVWSSGLLVAAMVYHLWRQSSSNLTCYGLAWATELLVVTGVGQFDRSLDSLAIGTLGLGLISQLAGDVWVNRIRPDSRLFYRSSWHLIPLLYAGFGVLLGHHQFTATTGLYTLAAAFVGVGVGRRDPAFKALTQLSLWISSVAWYELLVYQLLQAEGDYLGDGLTLLAGLAALIATGSRLSQRWLLPYLRLQPQEFVWIAHLHWVAGSGVAFFAPPIGLSNSGFWLWLLMSSALAGYALANGRSAPAPETPSHPVRTDRWLYAGIAEALGVLGYGLYRSVPETGWLLAWAGTIAALVAVGLYYLPWQRGGWNSRPWRNMAILLPAVIVLLTAGEITVQSLLIVAAFYAWIAKTEVKPRLSYVGLLLLNWAALRYLVSIDWLTLISVGALTAGSLLYIAQIDPDLQTVSAKEQRHWLRSFAVGILSLTMLYQAELETGTTALLISLLTLGAALIMIFAGLALRVRAFLYVGTATFVVRVLRLLWLFIDNYSLLLWAIGIVIGLLLIWIAATFEARRSQVNALMQYWLTELDHWE